MPTRHKAGNIAQELAKLRQKLKLSRQELAAKLRVKASTVSVWEVARGQEGYRPSADILAKFADLTAMRGRHFDQECIWLLKEAGALTEATSRTLDRRRKPRPSKPGQIISAPLIDTASGYRPEASFVDGVELPAALVPRSASLGCVRIESSEVIACSPFSAGGLVVVDQSETDLERLLPLLWDSPFIPVAVHYLRLPNLLPVAQFEPGQRISLPPLAGTGAKAEELRPKRGVRPHDPTRRLEVPGIHIGWLALEQYPSEPSAPWRIVLRGASVVGLWGGGALAITKWHQGSGPLGMESPLSDLVEKDLRVLGRVVLWLPEWSPATGAREENV